MKLPKTNKRNDPKKCGVKEGETVLPGRYRFIYFYILAMAM